MDKTHKYYGGELIDGGVRLAQFDQPRLCTFDRHAVAGSRGGCKNSGECFVWVGPI